MDKKNINQQACMTVILRRTWSFSMMYLRWWDEIEAVRSRGITREVKLYSCGLCTLLVLADALWHVLVQHTRTFTLQWHWYY